MSVTITSTALSGTTVTARATAVSAPTWKLDVSRPGQQDQLLNASSSTFDSATSVATATWLSVPTPASYMVMASVGVTRGDSQPVPFPTIGGV